MLRLLVGTLASKQTQAPLFVALVYHSYSVNPPKGQHTSYTPYPTVARKNHSSRGDLPAVDPPGMIISSMFTNHYHTPTLTSERDAPINKHHHYHLPTLPEKKKLTVLYQSIFSLTQTIIILLSYLTRTSPSQLITLTNNHPPSHPARATHDRPKSLELHIPANPGQKSQRVCVWVAYLISIKFIYLFFTWGGDRIL